MADVVDQPLVTYVLAAAQGEIITGTHRALMIGSKFTGPLTAPDGVLQTDLGNNTQLTEERFGKKSLLANGIRAWKRVNQVTQLDAIGLEDATVGQTSANGNIIFGVGTALVTGSYEVTITSASLHRFLIPVAINDTATILANKLVALIAADITIVTNSSSTLGNVNIEAISAGTEGNDITLIITGVVSGLNAPTVNGMTGGVGNPSLTGIFDQLDDIQYDTIVFPGSWDLNELNNFLKPRFNTANAVLDGIAVVTRTDTESNLAILGNSFNSEVLVIEGIKNVVDTTYNGSSVPELGFDVSATVGAVRARRLTEGAILTDLVVNVQGRDAFGGAGLASLPYHNTPLGTLSLIPFGRGFSQSVRKSLVLAGISGLGNNPGQTRLILDKTVTTYKTNLAGDLDPTFGLLNYVDESVGIRKVFFLNTKAQFRQTRLTSGELIPNRASENDASIRQLFSSLYRTLSGEDFALTVAGEDAEQAFQQGTVVDIDFANGGVDATFNAVTVVNQLRDVQGLIKIAVGGAA